LPAAPPYSPEHRPTPALPNRALTRAGESPRIPGNRVTLLRDGPEVFSAWLDAIATARRFILFENYIFNNDRIGTRITDALIEAAKAGVAVYFLYDWFGCIGTSRSLWIRMRHAGIEVRAFNPGRLSDPVGAFRRDHRKSLCVDGEVGFVGGLCVGDPWAGDPALGVPPWRDTAVRIAGPAARALCLAFNETWSLCGPPLPSSCFPQDDEPAASSQPASPGGAPVRLISGEPGRSRVYRLAQVLMATAAHRIWITDAYFLTPPSLYESLISAARDGVDVRVLVPGRSDLPWVSFIGRSGYTGLLAAGVRIFEWEGPMLHAKTSVIDGFFCRVGSSNLNLASLLTNWELDVAIEDRDFGQAMEEMFLRDLQQSSELILRQSRARFQGRIQRAFAVPLSPPAPGDEAPLPRLRRQKPMRTGERTRAVVARAGAAFLGVALRRQFEHSAWTVSALSAALLLLFGGLGLWRPAYLGLGLALLLIWLGLASLLQAVSQWRQRDLVQLPAQQRRRLRRKRGDYLQQAKGSARSHPSPPPNQTEP
jgi:cardiolipin synthase